MDKNVKILLLVGLAAFLVFSFLNIGPNETKRALDTFDNLASTKQVSLMCVVNSYTTHNGLKFRGHIYRRPATLTHEDDGIYHLFYIAGGKEEWITLSGEQASTLNKKYALEKNVTCKKLYR